MDSGRRKVLVGIYNNVDNNATLWGDFIAVFMECLLDSFFGKNHFSQPIENVFQLVAYHSGPVLSIGVINIVVNTSFMVELNVK